mgnify:CR=1 FL=1
MRIWRFVANSASHQTIWISPVLIFSPWNRWTREQEILSRNLFSLLSRSQPTRRRQLQGEVFDQCGRKHKEGKRHISKSDSKRNTGTFLRNPSSTPAPSSFLRNSSHIYQYVITWLLSDLNWIFRFLLLTRKIQVVIWVIQSVHDNCS